MDEGREVGALWAAALLLVDDPVGGEVSGVMTAVWSMVPLSAVVEVDDVSLVFGSREWVAVGVRSGECTMDGAGEARGDGKPDPFDSRPPRSLDSRDATYQIPKKGGERTRQFSMYLRPAPREGG